jgi:anti-sigma-K factor RskA
MVDPNRAQETRDIPSGGSGTLIVAGDRALFSASDLKRLPDDRTYQLWIMRPDGARSVGVLGRGGSGDVQQFVEGVKETDQIGLSVEPDGGSDEPTTDPVLVLPVPA